MSTHIIVDNVSHWSIDRQNLFTASFDAAFDFNFALRFIAGVIDFDIYETSLVPEVCRPRKCLIFLYSHEAEIDVRYFSSHLLLENFHSLFFCYS